jgi:hypothetical protein
MERVFSMRRRSRSVLRPNLVRLSSPSLTPEDESDRLRRLGQLSGRRLVPRRELRPLSLDLGSNHQLVLETVGAERERFAARKSATVQHRHGTTL